jgi:AraC family transcriptional regulator
VLDYIEANLEGDLTLDRLASIACLSRFHFARAFKTATGLSPHRYVVTAKRLEHAKALLGRGEQRLVDIAFALKFSCQANFTRAFHQVKVRHRVSIGGVLGPNCRQRQVFLIDIWVVSIAGK